VTRLATAAMLGMTALVLSGCGRQVYRATPPDLSTACVDNLAAVASRPLAYLEPKEKAQARRVEFAAVAACVRMEGTALPVALYRLDALHEPSEIDVRIVLSEGGTFAASAEVLDANFQTLRRYGFSDFARRTNEYSLSVFVDRRRPVAPTYLLLRPDPSQVGGSDTAIASQSSGFMLPGGGSYTYGTEVTRRRPLVGAGQLQVVPYPVRPIGFETEDVPRG